MSTQTSLGEHNTEEPPEDGDEHEHEHEHEGVSVACETSLIDGEWETKDAAVYPPGYPRLCPHKECFGALVADEVWAEDGTVPDFDHTEHAEELVRSNQRGHSRRYHRRGK